ncbi:hypothetical protein VNI00_016537 [Paramarasmius palmivorus]|uniref:Uncharacterized protein n=1 Tax=Paramarasmius palmivorus TaxID=297713 RepID=A0AAW0BGK3_9AGAR
MKSSKDSFSSPLCKASVDATDTTTTRYAIRQKPYARMHPGPPPKPPASIVQPKASSHGVSRDSRECSSPIPDEPSDDTEATSIDPKPFKDPFNTLTRINYLERRHRLSEAEAAELRRRIQSRAK